jgi:transposase
VSDIPYHSHSSSIKPEIHISTSPLYEGRDLFERFRETTAEIARLQSKLRDGRYSSQRIQRLYRKRTRRRDHAQEALCRDLIERLYDEGVATVYIGGLTARGGHAAFAGRNAVVGSVSPPFEYEPRK